VARWIVLVLVLWLLPIAAARASTPTIELYTMGPGDNAYTLFGHAAICVVEGPRSRCFNYGTADFSRPGALALAFLRGNARYWVSTTTREALLHSYREMDRTIYRQALPLSPSQARRASELLERDLQPDRRTYVYDHFKDNCSTRLRDLIDVVSDGALRASARRQSSERLRDMVRHGFAGHPGLLALSELLIGREIDRNPTPWEAMFLPSVLREEVARSLGVKPVVAYARRAPVMGGEPMEGQALVFVVGATLSLLLAAGFSSRTPSMRRASLVAAGMWFGVLAVAVDGMVAASPIPALRANELAIVFLPLDLALMVLRGRALTTYAGLRTLWILFLALLAALGVLVQPIGAPLAAMFVFFAPVAGVAAQRARRIGGLVSPESLGETPRTR
jgi:hypothetical protein